MEEVVVAAVVSSKEQSDGCSACRCASDGNVLRVNSEFANVLLYPLQSLDLIFQTIVGTAALDDLIRSQETIRSNAVVEVDDNNVVVAGFNQTRAVVVGVRVCVESTALDEEVDGERVVRSGIRRSEDVQEETVLG